MLAGFWHWRPPVSFLRWFAALVRVPEWYLNDADCFTRLMPLRQIPLTSPQKLAEDGGAIGYVRSEEG
jgi:hypothetical protein